MPDMYFGMLANLGVVLLLVLILKALNKVTINLTWLLATLSILFCYFLALFKGKEHLAPLPQYIDIIRSLIGGTLSILILILLSKLTNNLFIMAPFGATCVILYAVSQSPLAQARAPLESNFRHAEPAAGRGAQLFPSSWTPSAALCVNLHHAQFSQDLSFAQAPTGHH